MFVSDNVNKSINAVDSRNLCLSYSKRESKVFALDNFNITIPVGCIYCLIGPSGCGKTTFLRSLIGLQRLDQGETRLFGYPLGHRDLAIPGHNLGYMPQDVALNDDLTIGEMINYFGRLAGVSKDKIDESKTYYLERLNIPNCSRLIGSLSGGQKRRVSFICTLVHRPKLIILDEPTVGCDPIVIESMWSLLFEVTKEQRSTVILTTHYLEEARKTDTIGFMRKGVLLAQGSPAKVLDRYKVSTIEEAFAKMCKQDKIEESLAVSASKLDPLPDLEPESTEVSSQFIREKLKDFYKYNRTFCAVLSRIFLRLTKLKAYLFGSTFVVCFLIILTIICIGGTPHDLSIGVVIEEDSKFCEMFLSEVNAKIINFIRYNDTEKAYHDAKNEKIRGYLTISPEFSNDLINLYTFNTHSGDFHPPLVYHGNTNKRLIVDTIMVDLQRALDRAAIKLMNITGLEPRIAERFFSVREPIASPYSDEDLYNAINYQFPRFMLAWAYTATLMLSVFTFFRDRCEAMFERNLAAGATLGQLIISHLLSSTVLPLINSCPVLLFSIYVFGLPCEGPFLLTWTIYMITCVTSICTAFLSASIILDMVFVFIFVSSYIFAAIPCAALVWPKQAFPYFLAPAEYVFPMSIFYDQIIRVMVHGVSWNDSDIQFALAYGAVYIILTLSLLRYRLSI